MSNAVIQFHPDGFDTSARLMGRQAAGESFLRGFFRHADVDAFRLWNWGDLPLGELQEVVRRIEPPTKPVQWLGRSDFSRFAQTGCVYLPSPGNAQEAWNRRLVGPSSYSICGVTHTTASAAVMDATANLLLAPTEPWDALICTSSAVAESVERQHAGVAEYLRERFWLQAIPKPRLPVIPLGLNTQDYRRDEASRRSLRDRLGITDDTVVVLFVGRFSYWAKMNPGPMAIAMERAAKTSPVPVHWVWSGWAHNDHVAKAYQQAVRSFSPSVRTTFLDGRHPDIRFPIWSAADVFFSLSDNIQETFGLTPVEAMAAGLPSVISDWNGYRDTVRHGVDGFRAPTWAARPSSGRDLAFQYANDWLTYDRYVGQTSQFAAVDVEAAAAALARLFAEPELRRSMGAAAQARAIAEFDWARIIPRYQALWSELAEIRRANAPRPRGPLNPWRPDPFALFAGYPTRHTTGATLIAAADGATPEAAAALLDQDVISFASPVLPGRSEAAAIIQRLQETGMLTVDDLLSEFPAGRRGLLERGLTWLAKFGMVRLGPAPDVLPE